MVDKNVLDIVASIQAGDFESAMSKITEAPPTARPKVLASTVDMLGLKMHALLKQLDNAKSIIAKYEAMEDAYAGTFTDTLCMSINTHPEALKASYLYSVAWFRTLEFSMPVKVSIAQRLIDKVSEFNPTYVSGLWENIVNGNPGALDAIAFDNADRIEE